MIDGTSNKINESTVQGTEDSGLRLWACVLVRGSGLLASKNDDSWLQVLVQRHVRHRKLQHKTSFGTKELHFKKPKLRNPCDKAYRLPCPGNGW